MSFISSETLSEYGATTTLPGKVLALVEQQKATWETAALNYGLLSKTDTRCFHFPHFRIICLHNPGRIRSTAADTSAVTILSRPCFLCEANRPVVQEGIPWGEHFVILVNPYPIFPVHLTIPSLLHLPQQIDGNLESLLQLTRDLEEFTLFYNGPRCGASAPDHFHFQACPQGYLPVEKELEELTSQAVFQWNTGGETEITAVSSDFLRFILFRSKSAGCLEKWTMRTIDLLRKEEKAEPMINLLSFYRDYYWHLLLFPRAKQRPSHFYENDPAKLLISPAAVELGGLVILPRKEDFLKITPHEVAEVFEEVTISKKDFRELAGKLIAFN